MLCAEEIVSNPLIQWGFAGFSMALLAFAYWLVKVQIANGKTDRQIAERSATVIEGNNKALEKLAEKFEAETETSARLREELLRRPCLLNKQD